MRETRSPRARLTWHIASLATTLACWLTTIFADGVGILALAQQSIVAKSQPPAVGAVASDIMVAGQAGETTVSLDLSVGVLAEVYTLANPYRVIIDLPDVAFDAAAATPNQTSGGLIAASHAPWADMLGSPMRVP